MRCFDPVMASTSTLSSKTRKQAQQAGKLSLAFSHSIRMRRLLSPYGEALKGADELRRYQFPHYSAFAGTQEAL